MTDQILTKGLEKTIKIVDQKGKVLTELQKIVKDVTVEEFKKMLVNFKAFRTLIISLHTNILLTFPGSEYVKSLTNLTYLNLIV